MLSINQVLKLAAEWHMSYGKTVARLGEMSPEQIAAIEVGLGIKTQKSKPPAKPKDDKRKIRKPTRPVVEVIPSGEVLDRWGNLDEAADAIGMDKWALKRHVDGRVINRYGNRGSAYVYEGDPIPPPYTAQNGRQKVEMYNEAGQSIRIFDSVYAASQALGMTSGVVSREARGKSKSLFVRRDYAFRWYTEEGGNGKN